MDHRISAVGSKVMRKYILRAGDRDEPDPGVTAQTTIRQEICSGVDADNIKMRDVNGFYMMSLL